MYYYVYRITNKIEKKHYYGSRSCKILPSLDLGIKYFSSSSDKCFILDQKNNKENYRYKIIKVFYNNLESLLFEIKLHEKLNVDVNPSFYNKSKQTTTKWSSLGRVFVKDEKGNSFSVSKEDPRYISKLLIPFGKGVPKPEGFGEKVSKGLSGVHKSKQHVEKALKTKRETIDENGLDINKLGWIKANNTKINKICENGLNVIENNKIKSHFTKTNTIDENGDNIYTSASKLRVKRLKETFDTNKKTKFENMIINTRKTKITTFDENGKNIYQNASQKAANTMKKLDKDGLSTYQKNGHKISITKSKKSKRYDVLSIRGFIYRKSLTPKQIYIISRSLIYKTKENYLGKAKYASTNFIRKNKGFLVGLYVVQII